MTIQFSLGEGFGNSVPANLLNKTKQHKRSSSECMQNQSTVTVEPEKS